jgi:hypothetical protein
MTFEGDADASVDAFVKAFAGWFYFRVKEVAAAQGAQPEQEPVAWMQESTGCIRFDWWFDKHGYVPLYTTPPQRKPLTEDEISEIAMDCSFVSESDTYFARAIEKAHGIGGEA